MALKDLISEKGALDEAVIERIVGPYARYDVTGKEVHFTPAFAGLSNKSKILIYLVALQGWRFVSDEPIPSDARPADIEAVTGIPGGSVRPTLSSLSENHYLSDLNGRYAIRSTSLATIEAGLIAGGDPVTIPRSRPAARKAARKSSDDDASSERTDADVSEGIAENSDAGESKPSRKVAGKTGNVAATFNRWIEEGYFDEPRTLSDAQKRFRKEAIMVPQTSLPGYFLDAVRKGRLVRDEAESNGKTVWAYTTGPKGKAAVA